MKKNLPIEFTAAAARNQGKEVKIIPEKQ